MFKCLFGKIVESRRITTNNYDLLLENYMILIDKDIRDLYIKMNPQKYFTHKGDIDDFQNKHNTYIKMNNLIDEKLKRKTMNKRRQFHNLQLLNL